MQQARSGAREEEVQARAEPSPSETIPTSARMAIQGNRRLGKNDGITDSTRQMGRVDRPGVFSLYRANPLMTSQSVPRWPHLECFLRTMSASGSFAWGVARNHRGTTVRRVRSIPLF